MAESVVTVKVDLGAEGRELLWHVQRLTSLLSAGEGPMSVCAADPSAVDVKGWNKPYAPPVVAFDHFMRSPKCAFPPAEEAAMVVENDLRWALTECAESPMTGLTVYEAGEACTCELTPAQLRQLVELLSARLSVVEADH